MITHKGEVNLIKHHIGSNKVLFRPVVSHLLVQSTFNYHAVHAGTRGCP